MNEIEVLSILLGTVHTIRVEIGQIKTEIIVDNISQNEVVNRLSTLQEYTVRTLHKIEGN